MADEIYPVSHTEKVIAGLVEPVSHTEKIIALYGGSGGSGSGGSGGSGGSSYDDTNIKKTINMVNSNLNAHKSNADIHTTSEDKTRWDNKADISDIPTKLSQLNNDTEYIKNTVNNLINYYNKSEIYTKEEITNLIGNVNHLDSVIVTELPSENISTTTIYLIKESAGVYGQHMYISGAWADLGSTQISLDNVYTKTEADSKFALKTSIPTVPTKVSELTNDSGYLTEHQDLSEYAKKSDIKTLSKVPTKISELTNDSGYITFTDVVSIDETTKHWKVNDKDTGVLAEGTNGKDGANGKDGMDGADGVILDNVGYFGLRVENGYLNLYLNVIDESNADSQAPPFSLEGGSLYYTVGGTIQYESKETI